MSKKKITLAIVASVLALAIITFGSLALFTDISSTFTGAKAGTITIDLSDPELTNNGNVNPGDNDEDIPSTYIPDPDDPLYVEDENGNPTPVPVVTTPHELIFSVSNTGTKSSRIRQTLILSVNSADEEIGALDATAFSLMADAGVELGSKDGLGTKTYILDDGSEVTEIEDGDFVSAIKYTLTPDIFDGVGEAAEHESSATVQAVKNEDGTETAKKEYTYLLKMDKDTKNEYQGATIDIDIIVEALQYRNTGSEDWQLMSTQSVSGIVTGVPVSAVEPAP